tara:strand:+ start:24 stop:269 length:246 start_codon:yes stop_codon:yes gene_type:complete
MKRHYDKQFMKDIEKRLHELNKMEESKYIKERQEIDIHYVGYDIEGLKSVIKELEATNDILWEYISDKDIEEIKNKMEKIK